MRTEQEMMEIILSIAKQYGRIRIVTLEGSRTNFVTDMELFITEDDWLNQFGNIIMMRKPEDMELFPPLAANIANWNYNLNM